jgi:endoglucanase Acf2
VIERLFDCSGEHDVDAAREIAWHGLWAQAWINLAWAIGRGCSRAGCRGVPCGATRWTTSWPGTAIRCTDAAKALLERVQGRFEEWFSGDSRKTHFVHDKSIGTVLGYPEEYFCVEQLNDHHFQYGYWIRAAAEVTLRDPAWAAKDRWGGMVDLLVKDIESTQRGDSAFPFLRVFDPYEGHSWASGIGLGEWGNKQESSSEAINAWVGLILWGEIHGDTALRDLGIWICTTEIEAIRHHWFDIHGLVFPPEYPHVETSMLFGGKYVHHTWWTDEPRKIKGINLRPVTTASAYLGRHLAYIERKPGTLPADTTTWL